MMAQEDSESTWEPVKHEKFFCQFQLDFNQWFKRIENNMLTKDFYNIKSNIYLSIYLCVCVYIYVYRKIVDFLWI